jgi:spermidine synthase
MLFVPQAKNVLVIGLGTGITLRQVLDYSASQVDCAEISPAVVSISRHFSPVNDNVLHNPNVNLLVEDGRNLLLTRPTTYDVIISEPSNPWQTGNANLFTKEFYQIARTRMTEYGVFCQWLPLYDLPRQQLQVALGTFASSFPSVRVFVLGGDMILLGSKASLALDLPPLADHASRSAVEKHLSEAGLASISQLFERYHFANRDFLIEAASSAPLNTDNLPFLEFTHQTGESHARTNLQYLVNVRQRMGSKALE